MKKFGSRHISVVWEVMAQALWAVPGNAAGALAVGVAPAWRCTARIFVWR